jgi:hypothetical protein
VRSQHPPPLAPDSPSFFDLPPHQNLIDVLESRESYTVHGMNNIGRLIEFLLPKCPNISHNFFQAEAPNPPTGTAQVRGDPLAAEYQWKGCRSIGVVVSILIRTSTSWFTSRMSMLDWQQYVHVRSSSSSINFISLASIFNGKFLSTGHSDIHHVSFKNPRERSGYHPAQTCLGQKVQDRRNNHRN